MALQNADGSFKALDCYQLSMFSRCCDTTIRFAYMELKWPLIDRHKSLGHNKYGIFCFCPIQFAGLYSCHREVTDRIQSQSELSILGHKEVFFTNPMLGTDVWNRRPPSLPPWQELLLPNRLLYLHRPKRLFWWSFPSPGRQRHNPTC